MLLAAALTRLDIARGTDAHLHDFITEALPARSAPKGITVVDIDEHSLQELGPWPWPRSVIAELVQQLRAQGAELQIWDMFFAHEGIADRQLAQALLAQPDVVIGTVPVLDAQVEHPPHEGLLPTATDAPEHCSQHAPVRGYFGTAAPFVGVRLGHLAATPDADGRLRRVPAVVCLPADSAAQQAGSSQIKLPQLTLAAAAAYHPQKPWVLHRTTWPWQPAQWLERGDWRFALDGEGHLTIPYQRPHSQWRALSASSLLQGQAVGALQGQVVLIGATALGAGDIISTPYHPSAPGVSVHAELLAAASTARGWPGYAVQAPEIVAALVLLLCAPALLPLRRASTQWWLWLPASLALLGPLAWALLGRISLGGQFPIAAPTLALLGQIVGLLGLQLAWQWRQSQLLASQLQSFLPPGLAQQIATQVPSGHSLGQSHSGLLAGLRIDGLARWVGQVDSLQALALTHALQTSAQQAASEHGGALQYVQGDTLYLSWPDASALTTARALAALQALQRQLDPILGTNATASAPLLLYAALESGSYLLGLVGTAQAKRSVLLGPLAQKVTAILDLSPELDSPILLGPQAAAQLQPQDSTQLQSLGQFLLEGQTSACQIFRAKV